MRKIIALALCMIMVCSALSVSAATIELDDGGQLRNTGVSNVYGRTSGGLGGHIDVYCLITGTAFEGTDMITATTMVTRGATQTNEVVDGYITLLGWYTDSAYESVANGCDNVPATGFSVSLLREEGDLEKGTAGYNLTTDSCGDWVCGTTVYASQWIW